MIKKLIAFILLIISPLWDQFDYKGNSR